MAFFVNKPDRMETVVLCVVMTLLITVILGFTTLVADLVLDSSGWRVAAMTAISFGLLFLVSASKLRPIGGIVALIVAYALDLLGSVRTNDLATRTLLYPWLFVATPAAVSLVLALLVAPSPRRLVERELARWLRTAASVLREPGGGALPALGELLRSGSGEVRRGSSSPGSRARRAGELARCARRPMPRSRWSRPWTSWRARRWRCSAPVRAALAARSSLPPTPSNAATARPSSRSIGRRGDARSGRGGDVGGDRRRAGEAGAAYALAPAQAAAASAPARAASTPPKESSGFFLPDAFSNPDHVHFAVKTTVAAMFCYLTYSILDWPGIHTCLLTCYIVALPTLADSFEKLALRVAGTLVGAGLGIATMVYVVPSFTSVTALFLIVLAGALVATWITAGSPRIAYAGFQIAFAYFLCVVQDAGPAFDLVVARDRVIGMLFGMLVMYVVSSRIWPVSVAGRIESGLRSAVQSLVAMVKAPDDTSRVRLAAQANAALDAAQDDLAIAGYEPASVRRRRAGCACAARWSRARRPRRPLLLAAHRGDAEAAGIAGASNAGRRDRNARRHGADRRRRPSARAHRAARRRARSRRHSGTPTRRGAACRGVTDSGAARSLPCSWPAVRAARSISRPRPPIAHGAPPPMPVARSFRVVPPPRRRAPAAGCCRRTRQSPPFPHRRHSTPSMPTRCPS